MWIVKVCLFFLLFFPSYLSASSIDQEALLQIISKVEKTKESKILIVIPSDQFKEKKEYYTNLFNKKTKLNSQPTFLMTERARVSELSTGDIVKFLRENKSPLILIAEDKSAADVLEALLRNPQLSSRLTTFISINGKIRGAEYAELAREPMDLVEVKKAQKIPFILAMQTVVDMLTHFVYGYSEILYRFKPQIRQAYLKANQKELRDLSSKALIYSIDSSAKSYGYIPFSIHLKNVSN